MPNNYTTFSGARLQVLLKQHDIRLSDLANALGRSRSYFYEVFRQEQVRLPLLAQITRHTGLDFSRELPSASVNTYRDLINVENKDNLADKDVVKNYKQLQADYLALLKKYNALLEKEVNERL